MIMEFNTGTAQTMELVHQPAKEEQQWSDPFGSLKNWADFRISKRMSGEPDRFCSMWWSVHGIPAVVTQSREVFTNTEKNSALTVRANGTVCRNSRKNDN